MATTRPARRTAQGYDSAADRLSEMAYLRLRDLIVRGEMRPGAKLNQGELLKELGISKTPLREAIKRLELESLLRSTPRSGTYVAVPTVADITEVCDLRQGIEWEATMRATPLIPKAELDRLASEIEIGERAGRSQDYGPFFASDAHLHGVIIQYANNQRLAQIRESIESYVRWVRILGATGVERISDASQRHRELVDAIRSRDAGRASAIMAQHIDEVKLALIEDYTRDGVFIVQDRPATSPGG